MYASHNFQQELSTCNYGHTFRKLAVSKHVRIDGNETSDWDFVYNLLKYLKKQLKLLWQQIVDLFWLTEGVVPVTHNYAWNWEESRFY